VLNQRTLRELAGGGVGVTHNVGLAELTTLRLGGSAATVLRCTSTDAVVSAVRACDSAGEAVLVLGGGSNLVVADAGVAATVIHVATTGVEVAGDGVLAQAGADWDQLVERTVRAGLGGLECLSGIPGASGATPVQNVGAYGVEVADVLDEVQLLDRASGEVRWVAPAQLRLGYRTSVLKHSAAAVVLAVRMRLDPDGLSRPVTYRELCGDLGVDAGARLPSAQVRSAVLGLRARKGMVLDAADHDTWSAGSFFTNPVLEHGAIPATYRGPRYPGDGGTKLSAGWLIEHAGFSRGYPGPGAPVRLSTKHTLALTNRGDASTADLLALARDVRDGVVREFGIRLQPEPVLVGCAV